GRGGRGGGGAHAYVVGPGAERGGHRRVELVPVGTDLSLARGPDRGRGIVAGGRTRRDPGAGATPRRIATWACPPLGRPRPRARRSRARADCRRGSHRTRD